MARAEGDEELRSQLKKFGFRAGPITDTTRGLYLEKLKKLNSSKTSETTATKSVTEPSCSKQPQVQEVTPPPNSSPSKQPSGLECSSPLAAAIPARPPSTTPVSPHYASSQCKLKNTLFVVKLTFTCV